MDADKNGAISEAEFIAAHEARAEKRETAAKSAWSRRGEDRARQNGRHGGRHGIVVMVAA